VCLSCGRYGRLLRQRADGRMARVPGTDPLEYNSDKIQGAAMGRSSLSGNVKISQNVRACVLAVLMTGTTAVSMASAGMREGVEAYKQGDFAGALREWLPLAEQGNPNALYNVAQLYRTGKGVQKDVALSEK